MLNISFPRVKINVILITVTEADGPYVVSGKSSLGVCRFPVTSIAPN